MHHVADPDRALRRIRDLLAPGGLFAVVELAGFPRFLPDDAPEDGRLEERCHAARDRQHAEHMPHRGADWGAKLAAAGFTVEDERTITVDERRPRDEAVGRYASAARAGHARRVRRRRSPPRTSPRSTSCSTTAGPERLARRDDLVVRTERTLWAARP